MRLSGQVEVPIISSRVMTKSLLRVRVLSLRFLDSSSMKCLMASCPPGGSEAETPADAAEHPVAQPGTQSAELSGWRNWSKRRNQRPCALPTFGVFVQQGVTGKLQDKEAKLDPANSFQQPQTCRRHSRISHWSSSCCTGSCQRGTRAHGLRWLGEMCPVDLLCGIGWNW